MILWVFALPFQLFELVVIAFVLLIFVSSTLSQVADQIFFAIMAVRRWGLAHYGPWGRRRP
jgi:hypothetical protein